MKVWEMSNVSKTDHGRFALLNVHLGRGITSWMIAVGLLFPLLSGCAGPDYRNNAVEKAKRINYLLDEADEVVNDVRSEYDRLFSRGLDIDIPWFLGKLEKASAMSKEAVDLDPSSLTPREKYIRIQYQIALFRFYEKLGYDEEIEKLEKSGKVPAPKLISRREEAEKQRILALRNGLNQVRFHLNTMTSRQPWPDGYIHLSKINEGLGLYADAAQALRDYLAEMQEYYKDEKAVERIRADIQRYEELELRKDDEQNR